MEVKINREIREFLEDLTTRDQRMMFGLVTMVHTAVSKEQLDRDTETLTAIARQNLCQMSVFKYQQMDGLNTALPYGVRKINALRTLTTESAAVLMPFRAQEIMEPGGLSEICYGKDNVSKQRISRYAEPSTDRPRRTREVAKHFKQSIVIYHECRIRTRAYQVRQQHCAIR